MQGVRGLPIGDNDDERQWMDGKGLNALLASRFSEFMI